MAQVAQIKNRIESVNNTQKITNAMYLISSTKLQKAKESLNHARPYFEQMDHEIRRIFQSEMDVHSHYFYPEKGRKKAETYAYLVITADKGLAGSYNYNVLKAAQKEMDKHKRVKLYVVGEYGRRYFKKHNIPIEQSFLYTAQNPTLHRAREISSILLDGFDQKLFDEIRVIYSDMENEMVSVTKVAHLLPFDRLEFRTPERKKNMVDIHYKFYPSINEVINRCIPGYITGFIFGALVDSFSAEQNARMNAMKSANDNANDLLRKLQLDYNGARQSSITQEITEVSAGAKALHKKGK